MLVPPQIRDLAATLHIKSTELFEAGIKRVTFIAPHFHLKLPARFGDKLDVESQHVLVDCQYRSSL